MPIRLYKRHDLRKNKLSPSDMTLNSASTISIGSEHIAEKKKLSREEDITGLLEVTFQGSCLNEIDASR